MTVKVARRKAKTRIFIVDDHPIVRKGLADVLNQEPDMTICGGAETVSDALREISERMPDLAIVDLTLKGASGLELLKDLKIRHPEMPVLVLSMHDETLFAERALRAGAKGYVMKQEAVNELQTAIRRVLEGKIYVSPAMSERLLQSVTQSQKGRDRSPMERLSDREIEVFEMIGKGMATGEIARKLHLSVKTIETYRAHIKEKLNLTTAVQLVQHATQWVQGEAKTAT